MKQAMLITLLSFSLACSVGRKYEEPDLTQLAPQQFEHRIDRYSAAQPVAEWWAELDDELLTELVEEALEHNHDVRIGLANLAEARALTRAVKRDRLPTVDVDGGAAVQRSSNEGPSGPVPDRSTELYDAGFDAFWELDLFGRVSNRISANQAAYEATLAEMHGIYVSIAAETARAYIDLRGAQYRLQVAERNARNQQRTHDLIADLAEAGRGNQLDVARATTQLQLTRSTIPLVQAEITAAINRLNVLIGGLGDETRQRLAQEKPLPNIPVDLSVGSPIDLLQRRPDISAAERRLAAAGASYNLQVAELYPKITLIGNLGFLSTSFSELPSSSALTGSIGPRIQWAGFNLGRVRDRIAAADARTQAQLAVFEQTVLRALEETETSLSNFYRAEQSRAELIEAVRSSEEAVELARLRFEAGVDNFLDMLDAERTLLQAQERLAGSETETALKLVTMYKSLGGGWQNKAATL